MATTTSLTDRRSAPRIALNLAIRYGTADQFNDGELLDVSAGGLGISGEKVYPVGTELELRFRSRTSKDDLLRVRAVVRHHHAKRMGLEFVNVPITDFSRTLSLIERLTASQNSKEPATA